MGTDTLSQSLNVAFSYAYTWDIHLKCIITKMGIIGCIKEKYDYCSNGMNRLIVVILEIFISIKIMWDYPLSAHSLPSSGRGQKHSYNY